MNVNDSMEGEKNMGTTPAKAEATARYQAKTYKKINIALRLEDDADVIKAIEEAQAKGQSLREWIRELFDNQK